MDAKDTKVSRRTVVAGAAVAGIAAMLPWAQVARAQDGSLYVIAELVAKKGQEAALRDALIPFAQGATQDRGCLSYHLHEDIAHPGRFLTFESWTSEADLAAHLSSPAMAAARPTMAKLLGKPFAITRLRRLV